MQPTLRNGERFFVTPGTAHTATRFDVMVMRAGRGVSGQIVKRVIAVAGDRIEIVTPAGGVSQVLIQPGGQGPWFEIVQSTWQGHDLNNVQCCDADGRKSGSTPAIQTVPANSVFVLGDNLDGSSDSREFGWVDLSRVDGRVGLRVWPLAAPRSLGNRPTLREVPAPQS